MPIQTDALAAIQSLLGERPIAFHPPLARALGSATAAILLSQLIYWTPKTKNSDGWIWKTREDIYAETALSRYEQEGARKVLVKAKVIEEARRGVPARMHFRVNLERVIALLSSSANEPGDPHRGKRKPTTDEEIEAANKMGQMLPTSWGKNHQLDGGKTTSKTAEKPPAISESTQRLPTESNNSVVEELTERGVTRAVAQQLAQTRDKGVIEQQIEVFDWLRQHQPARLGRNAPGYLRKAIELDYEPPEGYKSPQQRQADAVRRAVELAAIEEQLQAEREDLEQVRERARQALTGQLQPQDIDGTNLTTAAAWQTALRGLEKAMSAANYHTWLDHTVLISCDRSKAVLVAPSTFVAEHLSKRFSNLIKKELAAVVGFHPEQLDYLTLSELGLALPNGQPGLVSTSA